MAKTHTAAIQKTNIFARTIFHFILRNLMTDQANRRIIFLDYMRITAFLSVLIGHKLYREISWVTYTKNHISLRLLGEALIPLCLGGLTGVILFFLTSGYIITHVLQKEHTAEFLIRRIFRIYPLFIFAVLLQIIFETIFFGNGIPPLSALVPRLLLIGDFFGSSNVLGGVDWTLRIEILFYVLMAALRWSGLLKQSAWLPAMFVAASVTLLVMSPFPDFSGWTNGYLNIYVPFLFIGSIIYLAEQNTQRKAYHAGCILSIFLLHLVATAWIQPGWKESNFGLIALAIFAVSWKLREKFELTAGIKLLSNLTFSVYLFHLWLWDYLEIFIHNFGFKLVPKVQILILLFLFCYTVHLVIEKSGIRIGNKITLGYDAWQKRGSLVLS